MSSLVRHFLGLAALTACLLPALAADDPPGRVGRLSQIQGDVIFRSDRQDPGSPATINWPVSSGAMSAPMATEPETRRTMSGVKNKSNISGMIRCSFFSSQAAKALLEAPQ